MEYPLHTRALFSLSAPEAHHFLYGLNPIFIINVLLHLLQYVNCTLQKMEIRFFFVKQRSVVYISAVCKVQEIHFYASNMIRPLTLEPNAGHEMN